MAPQIDPTTRGHALALLGLPETATEAEIVHAYRRLVRATHPDATGRTDPGAAGQFAAIHDAYQLLSQDPGEDPAAREPVEASQPQGLGDASDACPEARSPEAWSPEAWSPKAWRLPPEAVLAFRPRPPIVAGPVVVTPLPEQHRRHQLGPR